MKAVVFLLALVGCSLVVFGEVPNGEVQPSNTNSLPTPDISTHVTEFMNANPHIASGPVSPVSPDSANKCECGVFGTEAPTETDKPILTQAPMAVGCDDAGKSDCNKLCSALAEAAKERGPQLLCATLGHSDKLKASVHSRICGATAWTYTGLSSPTEICCHEHQVIDCNNQINAPPATPP